MPRPKGEETCLLAAAADIEEVPFGERRHSHSTDGGGNKNGDPMEAKRAGTAENLVEVVGGPLGVAVRSNGESDDNPFQDDGLAVWEKDRREPVEEDQAAAAAAARHQQVRLTIYLVGRTVATVYKVNEIIKLLYQSSNMPLNSKI